MRFDFQPLATILLMSGVAKSLLASFAFVLLIFSSSRELRRAFWAPAQGDGVSPSTQPMRRSRLLIAYAVGAVILGGSLYDLANDSEHWPFSQYPMFSYLETRTDRRFTLLRLYGVPRSQLLPEFPLDRNEYLEPFDNSRLPNALGLLLEQHRLIPALQDCLQRYEALRISGIHRGPALKALRLYRVTWRLDLRASNVNDPDQKQLLGEVSAPGLGIP
jgi:hypothetical protein